MFYLDTFTVLSIYLCIFDEIRLTATGKPFLLGFMKNTKTVLRITTFVLLPVALFFWFKFCLYMHNVFVIHPECAHESAGPTWDVEVFITKKEPSGLIKLDTYYRLQSGDMHVFVIDDNGNVLGHGDFEQLRKYRHEEYVPNLKTP